MSCRAAVFTLLSTDATLNGLGITAARIWATHAMDVSPRTGYYLILRWEEKVDEIAGHGPETLTIWCHRNKEECIDFMGHEVILKRVREVLVGNHQIPGADGTLTSAYSDGMSGDFVDDVHGTSVKNASFRVLSR